MHIAGANYFLPTLLGAKMPEGLSRDMEKTVTEKAKVVEALKRSFDHARKAVEATPDSDLDKKVKFFGQEPSERMMMIVLVSHAHEHLGQSIAYARTKRSGAAVGAPHRRHSERIVGRVRGRRRHRSPSSRGRRCRSPKDRSEGLTAEPSLQCSPWMIIRRGASMRNPPSTSHNVVRTQKEIGFCDLSTGIYEEDLQNNPN